MKNEYEYNEIQQLINKLQRHNCDNADSRCKKHFNRNTNELKCRVPKQQGDDRATFKPVPLDKVYDKDTIEILRRISGEDYVKLNHLGEIDWNLDRAGLFAMIITMVY